MESIFDWNQLVFAPIAEMIRSVIAFTPNIVSSLFIFLMGLILAIFTQTFLEIFLKSVRFDRFAKKIHLISEGEAKDEESLPPHKVVGKIAYWLIVFSVLIMALNRLSLRVVSFQLETLINFGVGVLVVIIIAVSGLFLSMLVHRVVNATALNAGFSRPGLLANISKWSVVFSTAMLCMFRIGIPKEVLLIVLGATYLTLCITFIISFGAGGTGFAATLLNRWIDDKPAKKSASAE